MSGLVALFHLDGRPAEGSVLEQLSAPVKHRAVDGQKLWISGSAGLAFQHFRTTPESTTEVQPLGCPRPMAICFDGRLDNRDELREKLPPGQLRDRVATPDAALALAAYLQFGESFAPELKGDFAIVIFDGSQQKLILARDVMGIRPLHYCKTGNTFLAASEIKAILAYPGFEARPDDDGLADLLLEGDWYERRITCFKDVFRVVPGHMVVVSAKEQRVVQYFDFDTTKQLRLSSIGEYAEALRGLFRQAVQRRLRSSHPVGVMVSGGLDSSAILCQATLLKKAGEPVQDCVGVAMTFPEGTPADEEIYLTEIEAAEKVQIHRVPITCYQFLPTFTRHSEAPRLRWNSVLKCTSVFQEMGCRVILDGYYGDQMMHSDAHLVHLLRRLRYREFRREFAALAASTTDVGTSYWKRYFVGALARDLTPRFLKPLASRVQGLLGSELRLSWYRESFTKRAVCRRMHQRRPKGRSFSNHAQATYGLATSANCLSELEEGNKTLAILQSEQACPFLDRDLVEFTIGLPSAMVNWQGRSKGLFREAMRGILPESIRERNWKADFTGLTNAALQRSYAGFELELQPDCLASKYGYLDVSRLQRDPSVPALKADSILATIRLFGVLGLEFWLKEFFR